MEVKGVFCRRDALPWTKRKISFLSKRKETQFIQKRLGLMLLPQNQWQDHKRLGFKCTEFSSMFAASSSSKRYVPLLALCANPGSEDIKKKQNKGRRGEKEKVRVKKACISAKLEVGNLCIAQPVLTAGVTNLKFHDLLYWICLRWS